MTDIYAAPEAPLTEPMAAGQYGSLERGIAGDYQFSIGATLSEAWAKTKGSKGTIQIALLIYFVVGIAVMVGIGMVFGLGAMAMAQGNNDGISQMLLTQVGTQLISAAIFGPMGGGLFIIGLRRSVNAPISAGTVLRYFHKMLPIVLMMILMYTLIGLGFVLLIIPGIYLIVAYYMALPLVVEKNLGPWQALETSRKAVSKRWFAICGLFLVLGLINAATVFTLFIGMIWTIPLSVIAFGILYRNMFGIEPATLN